MTTQEDLELFSRCKRVINNKKDFPDSDVEEAWELVNEWGTLKTASLAASLTAKRENEKKLNTLRGKMRKFLLRVG